MPDAIGPGGMRELTPLRATALYICFFSLRRKFRLHLRGAVGEVPGALCRKHQGMAQVIVLTTFMGGLALGSEVLGRKADRVRSPLRMFAFLQFGIGVYALVFDRIFGFWAGGPSSSQRASAASRPADSSPAKSYRLRADDPSSHLPDGRNAAGAGAAHDPHDER